MRKKNNLKSLLISDITNLISDITNLVSDITNLVSDITNIISNILPTSGNLLRRDRVITPEPGPISKTTFSSREDK